MSDAPTPEEVTSSFEKLGQAFNLFTERLANIYTPALDGLVKALNKEKI